MGVCALFGLGAVKWNNESLHGLKGLLVSPLLGIFLAAVFAAIGGIGIAFGLWLYSKFRPLNLRIVEDNPA